VLGHSAPFGSGVSQSRMVWHNSRHSPDRATGGIAGDEMRVQRARVAHQKPGISMPSAATTTASGQAAGQLFDRARRILPLATSVAFRTVASPGVGS
jgi:hypothetical protein